MARTSETSEIDYEPLYEYPRHAKKQSKRLIACLLIFVFLAVFVLVSIWQGLKNGTFWTSTPQAQSNIPQTPSDTRQIGELKLVDGAWVERDLVAPPPTPGAKLTKIRYGPWTVPPNTLTRNMVDRDVAKPCENCVIVAFQKGLEYADGTVANVDNGAYLHHDILFHTGYPDTMCSNLMGERFSTSGNERWVNRFNAHGKWGFHFGANNQSWGAATRIENFSDEEKELFLTVSYEWLPLDSPEAKGYRNVKALWLDIAPICGLAEIPAVKGKVTYNSKAWASTIRGQILYAAGHAHSGGLGMSAYQNAKELCYSKQIYGNKNGHEMEKGWVDGNGKEFISNIGVCENLGWLEVGDILTIEANYNSNMYALDEVDGVLEPVMGVMGLYIGE